MTNDEITVRLKQLAKAIPEHAQRIGAHDKGNLPHRKIALELELLNMQMLAVWSMLGEIAKRLGDSDS
jgi:hypothetical protein